MVEVETHIYGIYPKTEDLRKKINRWERKKIETKDIEETLRQEKDIYFDLVNKSGIDVFTDPLFNWYDILRPIVLLSGGKLGPLTRYKETNTFYRLPEFDQVSELTADPTKDGELSSNPPLPLYRKADQKGFSAFFPSPVTLYRMSKVSDSISAGDFYKGIARNYVAICKKFGIKNVTLFEAFEYNGEDLSFLDSLTENLRVYLVTTGEISEKHFASVSKKPYSVIAEDEDNLNVASKVSEVPGIKIVDAHNTKLEDSSSLSKKVKTLSEKSGIKRIVLANSDYLDFLPRGIADKKIEILSKVGE